MLEVMKQIAREKDMCVLATSHRDQPHCSLMAYATSEDCTELYMVTETHTTKYKNLSENPSVSLLIDTREDAGSDRPHTRALTVEGEFKRIRDREVSQLARSRLLDRHPHIAEFLDQPDAEIFSIQITSFLLLDGLTEAHFERLRG